MDLKLPPGSLDDWHMTDDLHAEQGKGDPFAAAMRATRMPMLITDPRQADNPIVFANDAFLRLSGYARSDVIGRNCRFLQGPRTDPDAVSAIRDAVADRRDISVDILNYRKDGTPFWNALFISPVSNQSGELLFYFASQLDVTERKHSEHRMTADKDMFEQAVKERTAELEAVLETQRALLHEVDHRVKNNLQMVSSLILMQSRAIPDENIRQSLRAMLARIEALSTVHRRLYQSDDVAVFDVADFARDLVTDLIAASGQDLVSRLDLQPAIVPAEKAAPLALMVNELVTNTIKHAFTGRPADRPGTLAVSLSKPDGRLQIEVADDGVGLNGAAGEDSFGLRLIRSLARQLHADVEWKDAGPGTRAVISIPVEHAEGTKQ
jgi:PAS domain S-box-containing protein